MKMLRTGIFAPYLMLLLSITLSGTQTVAQVNRGAGVPAEALPKELKGLEIKDYFVSSSLKRVGVIHALSGHVVILHRATRDAYFGKEGDIIYENDSLNSLRDSRCRIRLFNDDVITMAPNTAFSVDEYQDQRKEGRKSSLFSMVKGKAMFYALRLFRYKETRFRLKTPTAVVGVRGTKFGVHVFWEDEKRAEAGIRVADRGENMGFYLAQTDPGTAGRSVTVVAAGDGQLIANGMILDPGDVLDTRVNLVTFNPDVLTNIEADARVVIPSETPAEGEPEGETPSPSILISPEPEVTPPPPEPPREPATSPPVGPVNACGYFSGMLVDKDMEPDPNVHNYDWLDEVFVSASRQSLGTSTARAHGLHYPGVDYMEGQFIGDNLYAKRVVFMNGARDSGDLGTNNPVSAVMLGSNSHQEWGYWTVPSIINIDISGTNYPHIIDNRGYYIGGDATPDAAVPGFTGTVGYSGNAWGTYFSDVTGTNMAGTFDASVNFDTSSVTNFNMSVSGGSHSASITGASGSFSGSHFYVVGGTWELNDGSSAYSPSAKGAYGSLYGPNGEHIGGAWGMYKDSSNGAVGIFQGSQ